jgi:hypothetical protein
MFPSARIAPRYPAAGRTCAGSDGQRSRGEPADTATFAGLPIRERRARRSKGARQRPDSTDHGPHHRWEWARLTRTTLRLRPGILQRWCQARGSEEPDPADVRTVVLWLDGVSCHTRIEQGPTAAPCTWLRRWRSPLTGQCPPTIRRDSLPDRTQHPSTHRYSPSVRQPQQAPLPAATVARRHTPSASIERLADAPDAAPPLASWRTAPVARKANCTRRATLLDGLAELVLHGFQPLGHL